MSLANKMLFLNDRFRQCLIKEEALAQRYLLLCRQPSKVIRMLTLRKGLKDLVF